MSEPIKNNFNGGLNKDVAPNLLSEGSYFHAKNAVNNTHEGNMYTLSTEAAKLICVALPYTLIGAIPLEGSQWCVFTTDNINSEIGIANTDNCTYQTLTGNQPCLNFNTSNLITGAARRDYECGFSVYWSDGARNPDRVINTEAFPWNTSDPNVSYNPWVQVNIAPIGAACANWQNTSVLDCDKIRIAPLLTIPCISLTKSIQAGTLLNGTYQVAVAYCVNSIKVTDYVVISNPVSLFTHNNVSGSLTITLSNTDTNFREVQITIISFINSQLTAKILGVFDVYNTSLIVPVDHIDPTLVNEDLDEIPLQTVPIEKSDSIWSVNNYLIRNGIYEKPDFNYQPLANQIDTWWVSVQYPDNYYGNAGINVGYMRDEVYCFFIRFVYNDGSKSASYVIPGRAKNVGTPSSSWDDSWATNNTGFLDTNPSIPTTTPDGGIVNSVGRMGYWESTDLYPDDRPQIWDVGDPSHPEWDLCGVPIRHHRFPDQSVHQFDLSHYDNTGQIRVLGAYFENIQPPVDINNNVITTIVGYEILRGSREGNKSVVAKGAMNNMCKAPLPGTSNSIYYQNYPYNDLRPDTYLTADQGLLNIGGTDGNISPLSGQIAKNQYSFHSPDTVFQQPYLGSPSLKVYTEMIGRSYGSFEEPYQHPMFKVPTNFDSALSDLISSSIIINQYLAFAGGATPNLNFTGQQNLPWSIPLLVDMTPPDDFSSFGYDALYVVVQALNLVVLTSVSLIEFNVLKEKFLQIIASLIPGVQYARQINSNGFYNSLNPMNTSTAGVNDYQYVEGRIQSFNADQINNLFRNRYLFLDLTNNYVPAIQDTSRYTIGDKGYSIDQSRHTWEYSPTSCFYTGIKIPNESQYGQIGSVRQLPIMSCMVTISSPNTTILFGGDTYVNRYTEKNPFFFFNDWLINVREDTNYDYRNAINVAYPAYWIDNRKSYTGIWDVASDFRRLDLQDTDFWDYLHNSWFYVKHGYFYLFNNGVREFYVESDVNVDYRDWGELISERYYKSESPNAFTDLPSIFRSDIINGDILYKYDYSLSVSKFYTQYITFGSTLDADYDPYLAYTCYDYYPRRVIYSLPQNEELKIDNWRNFLPNNFYDFYTPVTAIKSISKTGALFMMREQSPVMFTGVQVLQQGESQNVAITVGDGGLFNQPLQNVANSDRGIGYGSCMSKYSVVNTPHGLFWVSQLSGKVFNYLGQLEEVSSYGLKWWFSIYLPSFLLQQFPNYPLYDNPVAGVGVQISYDETSDIIYVSKRDFRYLGNPSDITFINDIPILNYNTPSAQTLSLTDNIYFEDCSWKLSYDCKIKKWISFHDDKHGLVLTTRNHNMADDGNGILYQYNVRTDLFNSNFEIGFPINTGFTVSTLKNIEWYCESWFYHGQDHTQVYDNAFDNVVVWTDDQNSGRIGLFPKVNPYTDLQYPIITADHTDAQYSLKENTYRFNTFYDYTANRNALTSQWNTPNNGMDMILNPLYFDFGKSLLQLKRMRGYNFNIFLQKLKGSSYRQNLRITQNQVMLSLR